MLSTFTQLLNYRATAGEDRLKVTELFFDFGTRRIEYVSLDIGGWFDRTEVLIRADQFGTPDPKAETWPVWLDRAEVDEAPRWHEEVEERASIFALENWPPLVVGPFGSTYSPLLMNAQSRIDAEEAAAIEGHRPVSPAPSATDLSEETGSDADAEDSRERVSHMARATQWLGRTVYGPDGELGALSDIVVDVEKGRLTHLVISAEGLLTAQDSVVPFEWMRHIAQDSHIVIGVTGAQVESAPTLGAEDALGQDWQQRVRRHYNAQVA